MPIIGAVETAILAMTTAAGHPADGDCSLDTVDSSDHTPTARSIEVFYSYAREDETFVRKLEKQLSTLRQTGVITTWHDRQITPGGEWAKQIDAHLASARVIVLMVSADFVSSDYIWGVEVFTAMQRHQLGTAVVVPIVLRETAFLDRTPFGKLQMLPKDAKPVAAWTRPDQVWASVATALGDICLDLQQREIFQADAAVARRIYAQIAADAQRNRGERERLMSDLKDLILNGPAPPPGFVPTKRVSAMDAYIRDDTETAPGPAPPPTDK